jgi:hypothetical protein
MAKMGIKTSVKSGNFRPTKQGAGMTEKGVKAFRKANPGSKLKTAVTGSNPSEADAKRRKSFCARSAGQMKKFPEAAKDPDSRIRQARKTVEMLNGNDALEHCPQRNSGVHGVHA